MHSLQDEWQQVFSFNPSQIHSVRIYPSIGIARVGNSIDTNGWYYGPEVPGRFEEPTGGFKDASGAVKRQAARFRVYAFDANNKVICEANESNGFEINWSIEVANQKAAWYEFMSPLDPGAFQPGSRKLRNPLVQPEVIPEKRDKLIVTSGIQRLCGAGAKPIPLKGQFYGSKTEPTLVYLGEASTDDHGRLVVLAGRGLARSIKDNDRPYPLIRSDFDNPDWFDDTSDGWINATLKHSSGKTFEAANKAHVIGTTPKFTSGLYAPTSLYDLIEDVYERERRAREGDKYDVGVVDWHKHIWPLLRCPSLLSWVNIQANTGHGPNAPGNFFDEKWQEALSDSRPENEAVRKGVLGRMRLPPWNKKYAAARAGQGFLYFMPPLSGYGDRADPGDPTTFSSLTELQYDRLVKWSKGEFVSNSSTSHPPPLRVEELPLHDQPGALTKASLEAAVGAPLFPGIEVSWTAELSPIYVSNVPFTVRDDVLPGDLTKPLSLPWQSDFYRCRNYWWPSVRPDQIVTESEYNRVVQSVKPEDVAKNLRNRVPWERGIPLDYTDDYIKQPFFGNTFTAEHWHQLGFIVPRPSSGLSPIFVETQRNLPEQAALTHPSHPKIVISAGPILPTPFNADNPIQTIESLREHLQVAMEVELSTIPLYLFGMYTIKTPAAYARDLRYRDPIVDVVRSVVAQEMLHLSLAGNILRAVGGTPKLYDPHIIPTYPMLLPGRIPDLELHLRTMTKDHLQTYIDVEAPSNEGAVRQYGRYTTIGQFYEAIRKGLIFLNARGERPFHPETAPYQFSPGNGYQPQVRDAGGSVVVTNLASAQAAIDIIIDQGEGNPGPFDDPEHLEKDHYDKFLELKASKRDWEVYPVRSNPKTHDYWKEDRRIYHVSLAFDAAYCFLLITIEKLWTINNEDARQKLILGNMFGVMMGVLAPLAKFLVQQPIGNEGEAAAPAFGYYQFRKGISELKQVQEEMQAAIDAYVHTAGETTDQVPAVDHGGHLEKLLPIQRSMGLLLEFDH